MSSPGNTLARNNCSRRRAKDRRTGGKTRDSATAKERKSVELQLYGENCVSLNKRRCFCSAIGLETSETPAIWREFLLNEYLCDGIIRSIDNEEIPVHRALLSKASSHFAKLFGSRKVRQVTVITVNLMADTIKRLVRYVYTGECDMDEVYIPRLLDAAYRFKFAALFNLVCTYLTEKLTPGNCLHVVELMRPYLCEELSACAFRYIVQNFEDVVDSDAGFVDLSPDDLLAIISDDELAIASEERLFNVVIKWIDHASGERAKHMGGLSAGVRFGLMSRTFLEERVMDNVHVSGDEALRTRLDAVRAFFDREGMERFNLTFARPRVPREIIFVFGGCIPGCPTNIVETYDVRADRWITAETVDPLVRAFYGTCSVGNVVFLVGGYDGVTVYNSLRCFDPVTARWGVRSCMHRARCHNCAVEMDGMIYTAGGFDGTYSLSSVERYDLGSNQWSLLASMNVSRADCAAAVLGGRIFVAGGSTGEEPQCSVEAYDPATDQWTYVRAMQSRRSGHGLVAYRGTLYALGGEDGERRLRTVERLDRRSDEWRHVDPMSIPRHNFAAVVAGDAIYVVGGSSSTSLNASVERYDDVRLEWRRVAHLSLRRSAVGACVLTGLPNAQDYCYLKLLEADARRSYGGGQDSDTEASPTDCEDECW